MCCAVFIGCATAVTRCHSLLIVVTRCHSLYYSLSLYHLLHHSLSLVVIRYHSLSLVVTRCHSLSLAVPLAVTCCHSLSLVVTRCTTRLSFYKRSFLKCSERNISQCILVLRAPILKNTWERLLLNELSHLRHYVFSKNIEISEYYF